MLIGHKYWLAVVCAICYADFGTIPELAPLINQVVRPALRALEKFANDLGSAVNFKLFSEIILEFFIF